MSNLVRHICEFTCSPHQSTFINVTATQVNPKNSSEFDREDSSSVTFNHRFLSRNICRRDWRAHHRAVHERNLQLVQERPVPVVGTARLGSHVRWLGSIAMFADAMVHLYGRRRRQQLRAVPDQLPAARFIGQSWWFHAHGPKSRAMQWIRWCESQYTTVVVHTLPWLLFTFPQGVTPACSCVDCASSCPKPPPPEPVPQRFLIWGLDGYMVVMFFIFLLGSGMFVLGTGCCSSTEAGKCYNVAFNRTEYPQRKTIKSFSK